MAQSPWSRGSIGCAFAARFVAARLWKPRHRRDAAKTRPARWLVLATFFSPSALQIPATASEKHPDPVVVKAVEALGGENVVARATTFTYSTHSLQALPDGTSRETFGRVHAQGLDRFREEINNDFKPLDNKEPWDFLYVLDGDRGWSKTRGKVQAFSETTLGLRRLVAAFESNMVNLSALREPLDPSSQINNVRGEPVEGRATVGLRVSRGEGSFTTYFNVESGLPVKGVFRLFPRPSPGLSNAFSVTVLPHDYQSKGGLKVASRRTVIVTSGGIQTVSTVDITEFKALDEVDPKTFAKPE